MKLAVFTNCSLVTSAGLNNYMDGIKKYKLIRYEATKLWKLNCINFFTTIYTSKLGAPSKVISRLFNMNRLASLMGNGGGMTGETAGSVGSDSHLDG